MQNRARQIGGENVHQSRPEAAMPVMRNAIGVLLAGGQGERLWPLTRDRAKPAVPFGGTYRIIDITLSNCLNSDLRRVFVLTQYKALSLNRHVRRGWSVLMGLGDFIEVLPPQMRVSQHWYQGTADAVYQNIYSIGSEQSNYVFILSGDHIYKMNYQTMLEQHVASGADVTVATIEVDAAAAAKQFGVIETDDNWRIIGFEEKPANPKRSRLHSDKVNASMGVYLFNTQLLVPILIDDAENPSSAHDFGKDILPRIIGKYRVFAYNFRDENKKETSYWRDVGTVDAYHEANMDLCAVSPVFNLYDKSWPLHTWQQQYPPAKFVFGDPERTGTAIDSIVAGGSIISGGRVVKCIVGYDVRVNSYSDVEDSIIFNHVNIGRRCRIRRAIIDRHVNLPEGTVIGYDLEADRARYSVSDGGVVVVVRPESMLEEPE
ncbi:MAG TPA: glucose-1-phosphate adenylyltransferase [Candidatus Acidoferrales bacterium]|nr:glucose-1-phosphate adenylyltransferase [Candidatus Acidoferrales bacterium]